ncbi:MAG: MATE family efflux transporter [Gammaproteobacteria bacterium]|jgi:MATE family multidrug resistance protein|nr:MATE family efflux transporter [Gammaproteobacteria bacterium]
MSIIATAFQDTLQWRKFIKLAIPILLAEVLHLSSTVVDTIMAGQYSSLDLAGVSIGGSTLFPLMILVVGIVMATTPSVAQAFGASQLHRIGPLVQQSIWLAISLGLLSILLIMLVEPVFNLLAITGPVRTIALDYLFAASFALPAITLMQSLRSFSEGLSITKPMVYFTLLGALINIPINYAFIYGKFGLPAMGGVGCGWATTISAWATTLGMAGYIYWRPVYRQCGFFERFYWPQLDVLTQLLKVGVPIGISIFIEATMFAIVALFLAPLGTTVVAGHQLVLNFSSLSFMLPMSIGIALTIRIGQAVGAGHAQEAKQLVIIGFTLALAMATATCCLMLSVPDIIAQIYTQDQAVIDVAVSLFFLAAMFQLSDAIQVAGAGILRGYKDTKWPMLMIVISYWVIGLPLGYILGLTDLLLPALGAQGFWIGIICGLSCAAALLCFRVLYIVKKPLPTQDHG